MVWRRKVSSVRGRTMSSVLCVLSVLTNVAVRVDSVIHQSGNCELPRTQEAKKNGTWEKLSIVPCVNVDTFPKNQHICQISRFVRVILAQGQRSW